MTKPDLKDLEPLILAACDKYGYEKPHCLRVAALADSLFDLLTPIHLLGQKERVLLRHAAYLHDLGHFISYRGHHKHGAYLVRHDSTLAAYPDKERDLLSFMIRNHRKRPVEPAADFDKSQLRAVMRLSAILRMADGMDHDRAGTASILGVSITSDHIHLTVTGLDLVGQEKVLKEKAVLFKPYFGRKIVWAPNPPAASEVSALGESVTTA